MKDQPSTNLGPDHLGQSTDELRCCVAVPAERFLVYNLPDCEPEGSLEALREWEVSQYGHFKGISKPFKTN